MLDAGHAVSSAASSPYASGSFYAMLDDADMGAVVLDRVGNAVYMNEAARTLLGAPTGRLPAWTDHYIDSILASVAHTGYAAERWELGQLLLRVEARPLDARRAVLQVTVARSLSDGSEVKRLSRALGLRGREARVLAMLWRGMTNDEIARHLRVRPSRVEAVLYFLYGKLGVQRRTGAVMRAAAALAS